jgi:protein TonB
LPIPELPLTPPDIPVPEVELPKPEPLKKKIEEAKPEKPKEKPKTEKVQTPKPKPKPKPDPEPAVTQTPTPQPTQQQAAVAAPVQPSVAPAAPSAADIARRAAAEANWEGILLSHLEQHKKYPRLARKRHEQGTAYLRFRMHRSGEVLSFALERSAGHEALDEEVLAMIKRAQPLPALPPEVTDSEVEIVVPVQFTLR